ncbi:DUF5445 family protein, partial [Escherichia coli]
DVININTNKNIRQVC